MNITDDEFKQLNEGNTNKLYLSNEVLNKRFIKFLQTNSQQRQVLFKEKVEQQKIAEQKERERKESEQKEKERRQKERIEQEKINKQKKERESSNETKEWYSGGTLHSATISKWKKASERNKLATCADFAASIKKTKGETYNNLDELKRDAIELKACIENAIAGDVKINAKMNEIAAMCAVVMQ